MKKCLPILLMLYLVLLSACNSTRIVKPLAKKQVAVGLDFGGPIMDFAGAKIPVPFSSVVVGYGIDSNLTVFGGANITSAIFGTVQWDVGILGEVIRPQKGYIPGLSVGLSSQMLVDVFEANFRLYPVLDVNLYWNYLPKHEHYFYVNWGSWFDFWDGTQGRAKTKLYYPSFSLGHTFENKKMRYTIEGKYITPGIENGGNPVQFNGIGGQGSWGVYLSVFRKF